MRVKTPYSGLDVEFSIFADDHECPEFILAKRPTNNNDQQPLKECYIPVHDGQVLSVAGHLTGRLARARFDLIADGSFVGTRQVEADKDGQAKQHNRRRIEFRTISTVAEIQEGEAESTGKVVDGELVTQILDINTDTRYLYGDGNAWGVGSLVVIISVEETFNSQGYAPDRVDYPDRLLGNWEYRADNIRDSGIAPTHCLGVTNVNRNVIPQKCNKFFNQFEGSRFGSRPVAKLVYYYRNKGALLAAKCMPCPNKAYPVQEDHEERSPVRSDRSNSPVSAEEDHPTSLFMAADDGKPKRKLGGTLKLPKAYQSIEQQTKSLKQLVTEQELARQQSTSSILSREHESTTKHDDNIESEAEFRTVYINNTKCTLPSIRSINELMPEEGMPFYRLLKHVFADLETEDLMEAASILMKHMDGFAAVVNTEDREEICMRLVDLPEDIAELHGRRWEASPELPEPPKKRMRTDVGKHAAQQPDALLRDEAKRRVLERVQHLRELQRQLAEQEAAALAELEDEEIIGHDPAQHEPERIARQQPQADKVPHELNMRATGYGQSRSAFNDEFVPEDTDSVGNDSDGSSYEP